MRWRQETDWLRKFVFLPTLTQSGVWVWFEYVAAKRLPNGSWIIDLPELHE